MKIVSIINNKGGVGKTTIAVNLSAALAKVGKKVLLVDFDSQGNATSTFFDQTPEGTIVDAILNNEGPVIHSVPNEGFDLVACNARLVDAEEHSANSIDHVFKLRSALSYVEGYDYIFIDCPPALGWSTHNALTASTHVIVPLEASDYSTSGMQRTLELVKDCQRTINPQLKLSGILISKIKNLVVQKDYHSALTELYGDQMFTATIRDLKHAQEAPAMNSSVLTYEPNCQLSNDFAKVAAELDEKVC